jgi:isoleucyl-tRNA synthetase
VTQQTGQDADKRPSYKDTLNLLETGFGMRANAIQREPELQAFWKEKGIDLESGTQQSRADIHPARRPARMPTAPYTWATP